MIIGYSFDSLVAYVKKVDSESVKTTGAQTVAGVKTFSSNPLSSSPQVTTATALTRYDFVTGELAKKLNLTGGVVTGDLTVHGTMKGRLYHTDGYFNFGTYQASYGEGRLQGYFQEHDNGTPNAGSLGLRFDHLDKNGASTLKQIDIVLAGKYVFHEGRLPTAGQIGAYTKIESDAKFAALAGATFTGVVVAQAFLQSDVQSVSTNSMTRKDYVDAINTNLSNQISGKVPRGAGLNDYAEIVPSGADIATYLNTRSGFFNCPNDGTIANAYPYRGAAWAQYFNAAHANAYGFHVTIGASFDGASIGFCSQEGGIFKGWAEIYHTKSNRIQAVGPAWPTFELHIPGKQARMIFLNESGHLRFSQSNGAGGETSLLGSIDSNGNYMASAGLYESAGGVRVYSPNNPPVLNNSHIHTAAQGNQDVISEPGIGQVGSYIFAACNPAVGGPVNPGGVVYGIHLYPAACAEWSQNRSWTFTGTYKCMGFVDSNTDDRWDDRATLWMRIL